MDNNQLVLQIYKTERLAFFNEFRNSIFIQYLKSLQAKDVDELVFSLNTAITPKIDCTTCGNCCQTLMINVTHEEANEVATSLKQSREQFDKHYLEKSESGRMVINAIPCSFLTNKQCTIYEHRFAGCREFPALHLPLINKRLFTIFMHYGRCLIIFNVIEQLLLHLKQDFNNFIIQHYRVEESN